MSRHDRPGHAFWALALILLIAWTQSPAADLSVTTVKLGRNLFHKFESLASPGPLSAAHAALDQPEGCLQCHVGTQGLSNALCLACHKEIDSRMKAKLGYHGILAGNCYTCHKEHQGRSSDLIQLDRKAFDHNQARFKLAGAHQKLDCGACHTVKKGERKIQKEFFQGLPLECQGCHASPHGDEFRQVACTRCHSEKSWSLAELKFDHARTSFPLNGRHVQVQCAQCHKDMKHFNQAPTRCAQCHTDPHRGQFAGRECNACHREQGWGLLYLKFDHQSQTRFPLTGRHAGVDCAKCHQEGRFKGTPLDCASCHADPHKGQFSPAKTCTACHQITGWTGANLLFRHDVDTSFPLTGRHTAVACNACHKEGRFRGTPKDCAVCHADPHKKNLGNTCNACHSTAGFGSDQVRFDHNRQTGFALIGLHNTRNCKACHADLTFRVPGHQCEACHTDTEKYYAGALPEGHLPPHPDSMHGLVRCQDCHHTTDTSGAAQFVRPRCVACHNPTYGTYLDEALKVIEARLRKLPARATTGSENQNATQAIRRQAAHNFRYSMDLLDRLGAGK